MSSSSSSSNIPGWSNSSNYIEHIHPMLYKRYSDIAHSNCYFNHEFTSHGIGVKFWTPLLFNFAPSRALSLSSLTPTALSFQPPLLENERKIKDEREKLANGYEYTHMCLTRSPHIDSIFRRSLYTDVHSTVNYLAYSYSETKERGRILLLEKKQSEILKNAGENDTLKYRMYIYMYIWVYECIYTYVCTINYGINLLIIFDNESIHLHRCQPNDEYKYHCK